MTNKLDSILQQSKLKWRRYQLLEQNKNHTIVKFLRGELKQDAPSYKNALRTPELAVIAEIKRQSPSKGLIAPIRDPILLAKRYCAGGANALSILTDTHFFGGSLDDLSQTAAALQNQNTPLPILRKDFVIDTVQIAEAAAAGASAVLCIVAVLGRQLPTFLNFARSINMDVLVEVHDTDELHIALESGAEIIGINNRDLRTFTVNTDRSLQLVSHIPAEVIKVAESGITAPALARQYAQAGFDAVLIGEALVTSTEPEQFIRACKHA